jgi:hypothetical protein
VLWPFQSTAVVWPHTRAFSRLVSGDPYAVVMWSEREADQSPSHASIFRRSGASVPPPDPLSRREECYREMLYFGWVTGEL